jgi:alkanesulfonate monooxygenase SsuD/methylene tetrahydromethanopterin reductase-like flavin-dependent oxidoreductase (luciferase family)
VEEALALYRQNYQPSARYPEPRATICVWALAADTLAEAQRQMTTREHWRVRFEQGLLGPMVSPEEASAYAYNSFEQTRIAQLRSQALIGTGEQVAERVEALARSLALDEIVVNTWAYDAGVRQHSYTLLADAFGLASSSHP